jgi:hypothetical protein
MSQYMDDEDDEDLKLAIAMSLGLDSTAASEPGVAQLPKESSDGKALEPGVLF